MDRSSNSVILVLTICLVLQSGDAWHVSLGSPRIYARGDLISLNVNSLTSTESHSTFGYYTLPFCKPPGVVRNYTRAFGELLMGEEIHNSPYKIRMRVNEGETFLCRSSPLSVPDHDRLKRMIDGAYQVNMDLDHLPVMRYIGTKDRVVGSTGFPVGVRVADSYYVFNHLKFRILFDRDDEGANSVVGFEVVPCSCMHTPGMYAKYPRSIECDSSSVAMKIEENKPIVYSYEVTFEQSNIRWPHRWDAYFKTKGSYVHWFYIVNSSLLVIAFLSGLIVIFIWRTVRRNSNQYEKVVDQEESPEPLQFRAGDVFRAPACPMILCVMTGSGIQILGAAVFALFLSVIGFVSPATRSLLSSVVLLYLVFGIAAGYIAVYLWRIIGCQDPNDWIKVSCTVASILPGFAFSTLAGINALLLIHRSTAAIPFYSFCGPLLLWLVVCVPLTLIGGYIASKAPGIKSSYRANHSLESIPPRKALSLWSWLCALLAGTFPFGTLYIELFIIMSSFWMGLVYYFGHLLLVTALVVVISAEASILVTLKRISRGDWQWWWKSFFSSGSAGIYVFVYYCINYIVHDLHLRNGLVPRALWLGYSFLLAIAVMLATGAVGFIASFSFLKYLLPGFELDAATLPESKASNLEDGGVA